MAFQAVQAAVRAALLLVVAEAQAHQVKEAQAVQALTALENAAAVEVEVHLLLVELDQAQTEVMAATELQTLIQAQR